MKLTGSRVEAFLRSPDPAVRVILLYGPDAGLVRERMDRLTAGVCPDLADPFRIVDLPAVRLKDDPARLADEAAALSMGGGRRVVRLREATDGVAAALQVFLDDPLGEALVLVEAGELGPRSSLRRLAETADAAASVACYADDGSGLEVVIQDSLRKNGLTAEPDAAAWLADHLGGDRLLTRSELDKLALYMGGPGRVRLEDAMACIGDAAALSMDDLAVAAGGGDYAAALRVVDRLFLEGVSPIVVLRGLQRHFQRLHQAAAAVARGTSVDQALGGLKPPPHFRLAAAMRGQLARWPLDRLASALDLLVKTEIDGKTTGMPAQALCARAVLQLTRAGGRRAGGRR